MRLTVPGLQTALAAVFTGLGVPPADARHVAASLTRAEARGLTAHGVARLDAYARRLAAGANEPAPRRRLVVSTASLLVLDAGGGLGHPAAADAMIRCVHRASRSGLCVGFVRNSGHCGIASYFGFLAAEAGCIGLTTTNTAARMAPFGGRAPFLGTNPIAVVVPVPGLGFPLVLDMATSRVTYGQVQAAAAGGQPIDASWAVDAAGRPAGNAAEALAGALSPVAGPKGSALAVMVEVLCAALAGARFSSEAGSLFDTEGPEGYGQVVAALAPDRFAPPGWGERLREWCRELKRSGAADGVEEILLPGEAEARREARAARQGLALPAQAHARLREWQERAAGGAGSRPSGS